VVLERNQPRRRDWVKPDKVIKEHLRGETVVKPTVLFQEISPRRSTENLDSKLLIS